MANSDFISVLVIALGLSADCFAVALSGSISMKKLSVFQGLRTSLAFGLFQAGMPVLGWLAGRGILDLISGYDHWLAFTLLALVGSKMIRKSFRPSSGRSKNADITRGFLLLTLSVATSVDALAVGLSFAFLKINIALASSTIGAVAFIITVFGFLIGRKANDFIGRKAETVGGAILIAIGLRILLTHLF